MKTIHPSGMLKAALLCDAIASGALALLHLLLNRPLTAWLGLDSGLLLYTGLFLLAYANLLLVLAYTDRIYIWLLRVIVGGNVAWAGGCVLLMLVDGVRLPMAAAFLGLHALGVLVFAGWEYLGMRASSGMRPVSALHA